MISIDFFKTDMGDTIPCIVSDTNDFRSVKNFLIKNIFNEGSKYSHKYNRKHLITINEEPMVAWINSKGFVHFIIEGSHYRINEKLNTLVLAGSGFHNIKTYVKECVNYLNTTNIYQ